MKALQKHWAGATGCMAWAFLLVGASTFGQVFEAADVAGNRAIAASPRAIEEFPSLVRTTGPSAKPGETWRAASGVPGNRALASSPRALEQYPSLNRVAVPAARAVPDIRNAALAASPRMLEQFPSLARGEHTDSERSFEIAPLR